MEEEKHPKARTYGPEANCDGRIYRYHFWGEKSHHTVLNLDPTLIEGSKLYDLTTDSPDVWREKPMRFLVTIAPKDLTPDEAQVLAYYELVQTSPLCTREGLEEGVDWKKIEEERRIERAKQAVRTTDEYWNP